MTHVDDAAPRSHAIVSTSTGPEYYVSVLSIVDKGQLEPGCTVLLHNKVLSVVGLLSDETDPMVSVMKVRSNLSDRVGNEIHISYIVSHMVFVMKVRSKKKI